MLDNYRTALHAHTNGAIVDGEVLTLASLSAGEPVSGAGDTERRMSPATGEALYEYRSLDADQLSALIADSRAAFADPAWRQPATRSIALNACAEAVEEAADLLAWLIVAETGKPRREADGEVGAAIDALRYFAGLARDINGRTVGFGADEQFLMTVKEPAGVAALVTPWNFPLAVLCQKLAPALAAGCTTIIKPSPLAAASPLLFAEILATAGIPDGVVNVALGDADVGELLVVDERVDAVSFTGSSNVGRAIASVASSRRLKKLAIEAGGNAAVVVLDDADIDLAVDGAVFGAMFNQGECCVATSRILVARTIADQFADALAERLARVVIGDPFEPTTQLGPLVSDDHCRNVVGAVEAAKSAGGRVVTGGHPADDTSLPGGPYLLPTLIDDVDQSASIVQDEIFGPVATIQRFDDDDEAITLANDSIYGLGAAVWTRDLARALRFVRDLRAGTVWINGAIESYPEMPISGRGDSGFSPEFGREGMDFFCETKTVQIVTQPETGLLTYGTDG